MDRKYEADAAVIGGGLAGIVTALELLDAGRRVVLLERDAPERLGGLARESFGGIFCVDTPHQRKSGFRDRVDLALDDWHRTAQFGPDDRWPRAWAEHYVNSCRREVYDYLLARSVQFFPVVHWVERGLFEPGNSVPRFHMVWGTGHRLIEALAQRLEAHPRRDRLTIHHRHKVEGFESSGAGVRGCRGADEGTGAPFTARAEHVVCASGGICGDLDRVRRHWPASLGPPPATLLNGSHRYADGLVHDQVAACGGALTHLDRMWNYAAGVHHPRPDRPDHGLSLVPPKSALWIDATGRRIGPVPLVTGYDTRHLVESVCRSGYGYSWQILNRRIALKELAVSGSEYNDAFRDRKFFKLLWTLFFGNRKLVDDLTASCADFVTASSLEELAARMNALQGDDRVDARLLAAEVRRYDEMIGRGPRFFDDDQLRRIAQARSYKGDRMRTCKFQRIVDPKAYPLMAIREFILTRKSLGGIVTDLESRVLDGDGAPIGGLYAVGEAAGFGGGGMHGKGALEGTFLGSCLVTAQAAARSIAARS